MGGQSLPVVDLFLHSSPHVIVLESQAFGSLGCLDHAVFAVPDFRPSCGGIDGTVGHRAVKVVGGKHLHLVLGHGGVLVEIVGGISPGDTGLAGGCAVADGIIGVGVGVTGDIVGDGAGDFTAVVVAVADGVGRRMGRTGTGHRASPADGIVDIAIGGNRAVGDLGDEITIGLIAPGGGDAVGPGHLRNQVAAGEAGVFKVPCGRGDFVQASVHIVTVAVIRNSANGQSKFFPLHAGCRVGAGQHFRIESADNRLGNFLELGVIGEGAGADDIGDRGRVPGEGVGIGDIRCAVGIVDADDFPGDGVVGIGRHQRVVVGVGPSPGAGRQLPVHRVGVGRAMPVGVGLGRDQAGGRVERPGGGVTGRSGIGPGCGVPGAAAAEGGHGDFLTIGIISVLDRIFGIAPDAGFLAAGVIRVAGVLIQSVFLPEQAPGNRVVLVARGVAGCIAIRSHQADLSGSRVIRDIRGSRSWIGDGNPAAQPVIAEGRGQIGLGAHRSHEAVDAGLLLGHPRIGMQRRGDGGFRGAIQRQRLARHIAMNVDAPA